MPTNALEDKQALDYLVNNPNDTEVMGLLKIEPEDVQAYKAGIENNDVELKNIVFDKIAKNKPVIQEMPKDFASERMIIKNLIANEPELQKKYLEKKGFQVREGKNGLEVKRPGEMRYGVIDPEGIDRWDFTDVMGDVVEAIAGAVGTGAKAVGLVTGGLAGAAAGGVGAVPGGLSGLAIGSGLSGAIGGTFSAGKQLIGKAAGLREDVDVKQVITDSVMNALIPFGLGVGGKLAVGAGKGAAAGIRGVFGLKPSKATKEIVKAAEDIGAKPMPSQLVDSNLVAQQEAALTRTEGTLGGYFLRKQAKKNIQATKAAAEDIVKEASAKGKFEVGQDASRDLLSELSEKIKPAQDIYNKYESKFKNIRPSLGEFKKILKPKDAERFSKSAKGIIKDIEKNIVNVKNLDDLKQFRTSLGRKLSTATKQGDDEAVSVLGRLYEQVSKVRSQTLLNQAKKQGDEFFNVANKEIKQADKIYRQAVKETENALMGKGKKIKRSLQASVDDFLTKNPEVSRVRKIIDTGDPKRIEGIKTAFPKAYKELKGGIIEEIREKSLIRGEIDPARLIKQMNSLPKETRALLFGKESDLKYKALKTYLDSLQSRGVQTSGTSERIQSIKITNIISQIGSMGRATLLSALSDATAKKNFVTRIGNLVQKPASKGLGIFTVRQEMNENETKDKRSRFKSNKN